MNRRFGSLLALVVGFLALNITLNGDYLNYVRRGMFVWLLLSGLVLVALGVTGWMSARRDPHDGFDACSHGHSHSLSRAAWLLILPVLAVGLIRPAALGSFAASRQSVRPPTQSGDVSARAQRLACQNAPQPAVADSIPDPAADPSPEATMVAGLAIPRPAPGSSDEMSLIDFLEITYYDETNALAGVPIRLVGFVMPSPDGDGTRFLVSRFMINCCAADATLMQAGVKGVKGGVPPQDTWVSVTGRWNPEGQSSQTTADGFPIPDLVADKVEVIPAPENPYLALSPS